MTRFNILLKTFLACIAFIFISEIAQAQIIYVTQAGAGDQSGSSWSNAASGDQLQNKINGAANGAQVWVAEGTYYPTTYPDGCTSCSVPRNYTFQLRNGISIYGGFAGSEDATGQRSIQQHSTILSGDIGTAGDNADNAFHIILSINNDVTARLDGFTVTKGKADGYSGIDITGISQEIMPSQGAGYYGYQSSPVIANCTFTANAAFYNGAGMYNYDKSSPVITDCNFTANTSKSGKGAGISNEFNCSPVVKGSSFQNNSAFDAGGVYNENSILAFTDCLFSGNTASSSGSGGGVYSFYSPATFTNCSFEGNKAYQGGGLYTANSTTIVTNCVFKGNVSNNTGEGAGISNSRSLLTTIGCVFINNGGGNNGGAIYNLAASLSSVNCVFAGNSTLFSGGAVYSSAYSSSPISLNVTNCTFYNNKATDPSRYAVGGGAIYSGSNTDLSVSNCIVWGNAGKAPAISSVNAPAISFSNIQDGYGGQGNVNTDPLFVNGDDPDGADNIFGTADDGLALSYNSPLINKGSEDTVSITPTDITGARRIQHLFVDMGAYESPYDAPVTPSVTIAANPGTIFCAGSTVTFTARPAHGGSNPVYEWKMNGTVVGTSNATYTTSRLADGDSISVQLTTSETYVTSTTATYGVKIKVNAVPAKPLITATGATVFCDGSSVTLSAPDGYTSYKWSNGETTQSIIVTQSGSYSVMVTNASGCISASSDAVQIIVNSIPSAPVISVSDNCGSSILSTTATGTLLWSTKETSPSIKVSNAGDYTVTQTVNGCTSDAGSGTASPNAIPSAPVVMISDICGSSILSTTATGSLLWSTKGTTPSIKVSNAGTYSVTQTVNGCTSDAASATAAPKAIPSAPVVSVINNCGSTTLSTTSTGTLLWSTKETTPSIKVSNADTYSVTQTVNGCTSDAGSGTAAPGTPPATPVITVVNNCGNSTLSIPPGGTILWSNNATTPSITVSIAGIYKVTRTLNGCASAQASATAAPKTIPATPGVMVLNTCGISTLSTGCTGGSLLWSNGATTPLIIVSTAGTYTVTQTVNGCTSLPGSGIAAPGALPAKPVVTVSNNCGSSTLSTTATGALLWSTGAKTSSITVSAAGTYSVIQTVNSCPSLPGSGVAAPNKAPLITANNIIANTAVTNCSALVAFSSNVTVTGTPAPAIVYKIGNSIINSPYTFPIGATTVTAVVTNSCGSVTKTFTVTVKDNQAPVITCKPGATKTVSGSAYTVSGTEFNATVSDNCGTPSLMYSLTGATSVAYKSTNISLAGVKLNAGTTTITWKATDASGNVSTCNTVVKVSNSNASALAVTTDNNKAVAGLDIKQTTAKLTVKITPNPSTSYFTLQLQSGSNEKCKLIVTDITGRQMEQRSNINANGTLQIGSSYRPGTYIAVLLQGNDKVSVKLIKEGN